MARRVRPRWAHGLGEYGDAGPDCFGCFEALGQWNLSRLLLSGCPRGSTEPFSTFSVFDVQTQSFQRFRALLRHDFGSIQIFRACVVYCSLRLHFLRRLCMWAAAVFSLLFRLFFLNILFQHERENNYEEDVTGCLVLQNVSEVVGAPDQRKVSQHYGARPSRMAAEWDAIDLTSNRLSRQDTAARPWRNQVTGAQIR